LGATRSSLKADHLLQTADTFIRIPLPGASNVEFVVHAASQLGAGFCQMTAEFSTGGFMARALAGVERFVYVLDGEVNLALEVETPKLLRKGMFAFIPSGTEHRLSAQTPARIAVIEKKYCAQPNAPRLEVIIGDEAEIHGEPLGGDEGLQVRPLMPDGESWDFAVNTMTYAPGASLAIVEVHVMEHGLLMLEGGGIYRLGDSWYPVTAGDFIWMAPYCPQWFGALGKVPAKYLIYKDWFRHPLGG
jgi:(S)-ureidoglycine aminohydrolase